MASLSSCPPVVSQDPGSSQTAQGQLTRPIAVLPLLPMTLSRVFVAGCVMAHRVALSRKRYCPTGSRSALAKRNTILACTMDAAHSTDSVLGRNNASAGSRIRAMRWPANADFPLPLGRLNAAVSIPGAVAPRMNRR